MFLRDVSFSNGDLLCMKFSLKISLKFPLTDLLKLQASGLPCTLSQLPGSCSLFNLFAFAI